jgi:hypothetical protein
MEPKELRELGNAGDTANRFVVALARVRDRLEIGRLWWIRMEYGDSTQTRQMSSVIILSNRSIAVVRLVMGFFMSASALAWPLTYSAGPIRARVVDEQTGAPIEGAVVFASWLPYTKLIGTGGYLDSLEELEAVSNKDGWFELPGWGPKVRSPYKHLTSFVPQFRIFKSGYYGKRFSNKLEVGPDVSEVVSDWNGGTMGLRASDGDWMRYPGSMNSAWSGNGLDECFRSCPHMVNAIYAEWERIKPLVPQDIYLRTLRPGLYQMLPPSDREFLEQFR